MTHKAKRKLRLEVVTILVASAAMVVSGIFAFVGQRQDAERQRVEDAKDAAQAACFERFANQMADALEARTVTVTPKDQAERRFFQALLGLTKGEDTRAVAEKAISDYVAADNRLTRERAANPYPDPPREVCPRG